MAWKSGSVCHKSLSSYAIRVGSDTIVCVKCPLFRGSFTPYRPLTLGHSLGAYFLLIWGVGVVKVVINMPSPLLGFGNKGSFGKGVFQKNPVSRDSRIANHFSPYSIRNRPESQIPKFVKHLFLGVPDRGQNFVKICLKTTVFFFFFNFWQIFDKISPPDWNTQKQSLGQTWTQLGFGAFSNAVREKGFAILDRSGPAIECKIGQVCELCSGARV